MGLRVKYAPKLIQAYSWFTASNLCYRLWRWMCDTCAGFCAKVPTPCWSV